MHWLKNKGKDINWLLFTKILVGLFILFTFYQRCQNITDPDLGWHLRIGSQILETKTIPQTDNLSFTMPGYHWVDHEWLVNALLALSSKANLWWLAVILFTFIATFPFLWWLKKATEVVETLPILIAALAWGEFIAIRPQLISLLFFFIILQIVYKLDLKNESFFSGYYRFLLPFIFFLWANLHAGFFSGIILLAVYIIFRWLNSHFFQKNTYPHFSKDLLGLGLCALVPLANPYGLQLYLEIFNASTNYQTTHYIQEWSPLYNSLNLALLSFVAFFLMTLVLYLKKIRPTFLIIALFFFVMSIRSIRMFPLFISTAIPILLLSFKNFIEELKKIKGYSDKKQIRIRLLIYCVLLFLFSGWLLGLFSSSNNRPAFYPSQALPFLKVYAENHPNLKIFNEYGWGGYLSSALPEIKLFIDGRMPHWKENGNSAMEDFTKAMYQGKWQEVFSRRDINLVLLRSDYALSTDKNFLEKLEKFIFKDAEKKQNHLSQELLDNHWQVLYEDPSTIILSP